ncbi:hypothetical protein HAX54_047542, partial [Datura stramonium]|nr:hypothetical protein [Datura stramonium]
MGAGLQEEKFFSNNFTREVVNDVLHFYCRPFCEMDGSVQRLSNKREDANHWRISFQVESFGTRIFLIIHDLKARLRSLTVIETCNCWESRSHYVFLRITKKKNYLRNQKLKRKGKEKSWRGRIQADFTEISIQSRKPFCYTP